MGFKLKKHQWKLKVNKSSCRSSQSVWRVGLFLRLKDTTGTGEFILRIKNSTSEIDRLHSISETLFPLRSTSLLGPLSNTLHLFHATFLSCDAYNLVRLTFQSHLMAFSQNRSALLWVKIPPVWATKCCSLNEKKESIYYAKQILQVKNYFTLTTYTLQSHLGMKRC